MNKYRTSSGKFVSKSYIDSKIRHAKELKLHEHLLEHGYYVCTICWKNDCTPIDCSHIESVDSCQKNGHAERSWSLDNIQIIGRKCHQEHDKLNLKW